MNTEIKKKIDEAKKLVVLECGNNYKRNWKEYDFEKKKVFALEGTPDRGFVVVNLRTKEVKALRGDKSLIKKL